MTTQSRHVDAVYGEAPETPTLSPEQVQARYPHYWLGPAVTHHRARLLAIRAAIARAHALGRSTEELDGLAREICEP
jgi:hypothetical protein